MRERERERDKIDILLLKRLQSGSLAALPKAIIWPYWFIQKKKGKKYGTDVTN